MAGSASAISGLRADSGTVPRACRPSTKICSYEVQVQVQVEPRADLRHFKQRGTKPGGNGGGRHQLRNSAVRDRDGGQGREGRGRESGRTERGRERSDRQDLSAWAAPAGQAARPSDCPGVSHLYRGSGWLVWSWQRREREAGDGPTIAPRQLCCGRWLNLALAVHGGQVDCGDILDAAPANHGHDHELVSFPRICHFIVDLMDPNFTLLAMFPETGGHSKSRRAMRITS